MQMGKRRHLRGQKTSSEIAADANSRGTNNDEITVTRSKRWSQEERVNKSFEQNNKDDDEVVKYMSKLPGYLQGGEEESSNVLNVGVLDWGRLEKWKQHGRAQRSSGFKPDTKVSSTSPTLGTLPNASSSHQYHHRCKIDDQVHASSLLGKLNKASRGLQHSSHGVRCTLESEFASRDSLSKQQTAATYNYKSSGKGRRSTLGLLPEMGNSTGSLGAKGNLVVVRDKKESEKRAGAQEARERASESANKFDGEEKTVGDSNAGLTSVKEEDHHVTNTVLLRSRKPSRSTLSGDPHMSSLEDNVKVTREVSSHSLHFSDRISSSLGLRSQVPRSCPLSFDLERDSEDMSLPPGVHLSCKQERSGGTTRHSKTASRRILDQEKKRDPSSPSKRFSFSFGRLSRSFTFKEADSSAGGQPLTSSDGTTTKRCDGPSHQSSNPEKEKHCGSRVSPLRRLLDHPLLKSKASENVLPSTKERSTSSSFNQKPTNMDEKKQQQDTWRTRALFQLTTRNGIPLFQFVVNDDNLDNSRSILGATMKSSSSSFKDESVQYCTFYSVNEVKKKKRGSWLMHGHKEKQQHRFVYNVIGEMRLCNSSMSSDITEKISEKVSSVIRESVLVDETEQMKGRKEIAAVVIKKKDAEETLEETTVIIPGGVHSFPEKGEPTPLVTRWKSGGLCDCGGWDIGCKLHILSNKTVLHELDQSFKLFAQEESDRDSGGPVLAMTELKTGMYRVEFGSFLSHLQAFFVCVTVITCASEEKTVSKTSGRSSSPFAPPLSPVSRV